VLMWGIIGAVVLRLIMIFVGVRLVENFEWILLIFGAFLIITGLKLAFGNDEGQDVDKTLAIRFARKILPSVPTYRGNKFLVKENGKLFATPLLTTLIAVELADVMFAVDSIPAVFAITRDPFIIATSNIFAIVGLRSLYFLVSASMKQVHLLKYGLSAILVFVGIKMLAEDFIHLHPVVSLAVIGSILLAAVIGSSLTTKKSPTETQSSVEVTDTPTKTD
jgi:tellurite resistance protein TerC